MSKKRPRIGEEFRKPIGRPTKFKMEYCKDIVEFFDRPLYIKKTIRQWVDGVEKIVEEEVPNRSPFLIDWCIKHDINAETPNEWAKKYPAFSVAFNRAKELQTRFFVELGIKGDHNGFMTFQTLKNVSGWRDKSEVESKVEGTQVVVLKYEKD